MAAPAKIASWVDEPKETVGECLIRYVKSLESRYHNARVDKWEKYAAIYSEQLQVSLRPSRTRSLMDAPARPAALTWNLGRSLVETARSKITAAQPRPTLLTDGADFDRQQAAQEAQLLLDGVLDEQDAYESGDDVVVDMLTFGTGVLKTLDLNNRPTIERTLISEIVVDEALCQRGKPRQLHQRHEMPRASAMHLFKKYAKEIETDAQAVSMYADGAVTDMVLVYESWSLPDGPDEPGRHIICVDGLPFAVVDEEWDKPYFPFAFIHWIKPRTGFYGIGVIEAVLGVQLTVNRFLRTIDRSLTNWGTVKALLPNGTKIDPKLITNDPNGLFIPYDGAIPPTLWTQPILAPEIIQWLLLQYAKAFELSGISQSSAHATRDPGIPSAKGQREISDRQSDRLGPASRQYEALYLHTARNVLDIVRAIRGRHQELVISAVDDGALHTVDVDAAISLKPGDYKLGLFAGNLLSKHPASKMEELQWFANSGVLERDEIRQLADFPDIKSVTKRFDPRALYQRQIRNLLRRGTYVAPDEYHPVEIGAPLYREALFEAETNGVPDHRLQLMRDWLDAAAPMIASKQTQAAAPEAAPTQEQQLPMAA